jgi:hypothetical protein
MTQLAEPDRLELDRLEFVGEPFDPGRGGPGGAEPVDAPARQVTELASARVLESVVRDIRASVADAHASALDAQLRLQYRTAAAALRLEYAGRAVPETAARRPYEQTRARA